MLDNLRVWLQPIVIILLSIISDNLMFFSIYLLIISNINNSYVNFNLHNIYEYKPINIFRSFCLVAIRHNYISVTVMLLMLIFITINPINVISMNIATAFARTAFLVIMFWVIVIIMISNHIGTIHASLNSHWFMINFISIIIFLLIGIATSIFVRFFIIIIH